MASEVLNIHSKTPELRKIAKVVESLQSGGVILFPTDTGFALGCQLSNKVAINRIRTIRRLPENKVLTFLCGTLSNIAEFAVVSNLAYKTIKRLIPGPYTFVLPASKNVPRYAQNPKRKTAGIRVPDNILCQLLLKELGQPIISITAKKPEDESIPEPEDMVQYFTPLVDLVVKMDEYSFTGESTVVDMTTDEFSIIRYGAGITKVLELVKIEEEE